MAQDAPDWDRRVERLTRYLYCHSCKVEHPACLFSARQRQGSATRRRCIAHEGHMRLCQHEKGVVRWSELTRIRGLLENGAEYNSSRLDMRKRCEDISHVMSCAQTATQRSGQTLFRPDCEFEDLNERPMPELEVDGCNIRLRWTAHLPDESQGRPLTDTDLRSRITKARENCGRFLYPAVTSTQQVPEMKCFDPNDCDCVTLDGSENVDWGFASSLHSQDVCRLNASRRLHASSQMSPSSSSSSSLSTSLSSPLSSSFSTSSETQSLRNLVPKRHYARFDFDKRFGPGKFTSGFWPCYASDGCLVLDYHRRVRFERDGAIDQQWYQSLDPDSYSLTEDHEGFEIYWCRQKECRNYYGHFPGFSRIIRVAEYHRSVDTGCANAKDWDAQ